jgi:hypothetical protein
MRQIGMLRRRRIAGGTVSICRQFAGRIAGTFRLFRASVRRAGARMKAFNSSLTVTLLDLRIGVDLGEFGRATGACGGRAYGT